MASRAATQAYIHANGWEKRTSTEVLFFFNKKEPQALLRSLEGAGTMSVPHGENTMIVVTRHPAYFQYLVEEGVCKSDDEVVEHATVAEIAGRDVVTSGLPLHLAVECKTLTTVGLFLPAELRGKELDIEDVRKYAQPAATYVVTGA